MMTNCRGTQVVNLGSIKRKISEGEIPKFKQVSFSIGVFPSFNLTYLDQIYLGEFCVTSKY